MLEALCRDHGFLKATVRPVTEARTSRTSIRLVFDVAAGSAGAGRRGARSRERRTGTRRMVRSQLGLQPGARFDRVALDAAVARYVDDLRAARLSSRRRSSRTSIYSDEPASGWTSPCA